MSAPYKQIITIDFETAWDTKAGYTLSKMTTEEYIRDPRFKAFGACIHEYGSDKRTQWYRGDELPRILACYDPETTAVLAHNAQFDVSILEWIYNWRPCFIFDSLSMARGRRGGKLTDEAGRCFRPATQGQRGVQHQRIRQPDPRDGEGAGRLLRTRCVLVRGNLQALGQGLSVQGTQAHRHDTQDVHTPSVAA
jgi:hypothetical protein